MRAGESVLGMSRYKGNMSQRSMVLLFLVGLMLLTSLARAESQLTKAAVNGDIKTVKALLDNGADVNEKNDENITALFMASYNGHLDVVQTLLAYGADVNAKTKSGNDTALIVASQNGHGEVVKALLKKKADVNARNNNGATGLILASFKGYVDVVQTLLAYGADVNVTTYNDKTTALLSAERGGHPKIVRLLKNAGAKAPGSPVAGTPPLKGESFELSAGATQHVVELVPFKKLGISNLFVSTEGGIARKWPDKWPAAFSSGTEKLRLLIAFAAEPAYGVRLHTDMTSKSGKVELKSQGPPYRFTLNGRYYLDQEITPSKGSFNDGVYVCVVQLNGEAIAKIKWSIGSKSKPAS